VESERTVILSEREDRENEPAFRLNEAIDKAAFDRQTRIVLRLSEKNRFFNSYSGMIFIRITGIFMLRECGPDDGWRFSIRTICRIVNRRLSIRFSQAVPHSDDPT
jgi:hypothetical protein